MVEPHFPGALVLVHLVQNLEERIQAGQLHQVQPGLVQDPAPWLRFYRVQVQRGSAYTERETTFFSKDSAGCGRRTEEEKVTFDEGEHLHVRDDSGLQVDL